MISALRTALAQLLRGGVVVLRGVNGRMSDAASALDPAIHPETHRRRVVRSTVRHDMAADPDEEYYAGQYWSWMDDALGDAAAATGRYLDLGCGQGRLTLRLARWCAAAGGQVVGVDLSEAAITRARRYAQSAGQSNVDYIVADVSAYLADVADGSIDAVVLTELLFFHPDPAGVLREARRALRGSGVLFCSLRSQYFHALLTARYRMWEQADAVVSGRKGRLLGGETWQTWQTSAEARMLLEECGFKLLRLVAIGACSGLPGDPHAPMAIPSTLPATEQKHLAALERAIAETVPDGGRYMLAVARVAC